MRRVLYFNFVAASALALGATYAWDKTVRHTRFVPLPPHSDHVVIVLHTILLHYSTRPHEVLALAGWGIRSARCGPDSVATRPQFLPVRAPEHAPVQPG